MQPLSEDTELTYILTDTNFFFQKNILRMITNLPRLTPTDILHEQTGMEAVSGYVTRIASKFYFKTKFSDDEGARQIGLFSPALDRHKMSRALLACRSPCNARRCNSRQTAPHNNNSKL
jgi:hypothetical protein